MIVNTTPITTLTITGTYVIVNLNDKILYCWMLLVAICCIIVCVHILFRCHRRKKTLTRLQTRATRRQHGTTDHTD
jgi:Na+/melibiose symporter-like transporter